MVPVMVSEFVPLGTVALKLTQAVVLVGVQAGAFVGKEMLAGTAPAGLLAR